MTNPQDLEWVRQYLRQWYARQHGEAGCPLDESILIRDGFYCGRRFHFGPYQAVWFVEERQLKIADQDGVTQEAVEIRHAEEPSHRASRAA